MAGDELLRKREDGFGMSERSAPGVRRDGLGGGGWGMGDGVWAVECEVYDLDCEV